MSKEEIEKEKKNLLEIKEDLSEIKKENFDWNLQHKSSRKNVEINLANKYIKAIITVLEYIEQLEQKNNKQNKIIDEMADMISDFDFTINKVAFGGQAGFGSIEEIIQYFEKKVEEEQMKELEEAIKKLKDIINYLKDCNYMSIDKSTMEAIEIVLQQLENSIPKKKIEYKILQEWQKCPENSINDFAIVERNNKIQVLQELLEDK